jgi:hypothetical protein
MSNVEPVKALITANNVEAERDNFLNSTIGTIYNNAKAREPFKQLIYLKGKLASEYVAEAKIATTIDSLRKYESPSVYDGILGLENKLDHAGRAEEKHFALDAKETFAKFLAEWRFYESAQAMIAFCMAVIESEYQMCVLPKIGKLEIDEINEVIRDKIIIPLLNDMSGGSLYVDSKIVCGMMYWLADQCYIRWHR